MKITPTKLNAWIQGAAIAVGAYSLLKGRLLWLLIAGAAFLVALDGRPGRIILGADKPKPEPGTSGGGGGTVEVGDSDGEAHADLAGDAGGLIASPSDGGFQEV